VTVSISTHCVLPSRYGDLVAKDTPIYTMIKSSHLFKMAD